MERWYKMGLIQSPSFTYDDDDDDDDDVPSCFPPLTLVRLWEYYERNEKTDEKLCQKTSKSHKKLTAGL